MLKGMRHQWPTIAHLLFFPFILKCNSRQAFPLTPARHSAPVTGNDAAEGILPTLLPREG